MAQTGFSPIQTYSSSTPGNTPTAGNLLNNTVGSELAINIADGKLFYKDSANAVQVIGWKIRPATAGGTGLTSFAVGDLIYADTTTTLAKLADVATGNALISGGVTTAPSWGKIGLTTHVSGTLPVANGGTGLTTLTANYIPYGNGTGAFSSSSNLQFNGTYLGVGGANDSAYGTFQVLGAGYQALSVKSTDAFGVVFALAANSSSEIRLNVVTNNPMVFYTNNSDRGRIHASGGWSIGNTTDPGATNLSVTGAITASNYNTLSGSVASVANNTFATMFTFPNVSAGTWIVTTTVSGQGNAAYYTEVTIVSTQSTASNLTRIQTSTGSNVQMSGLAFQFKQTSGGAQTCTYSAIRIF